VLNQSLQIKITNTAAVSALPTGTLAAVSL
jgi:hypothetical protein